MWCSRGKQYPFWCLRYLCCLKANRSSASLPVFCPHGRDCGRGREPPKLHRLPVIVMVWFLLDPHDHLILLVCDACLQAGLVKAAAASGSVSAKARRKRKQQQEQQPTAAPAGAAAVAWANRRLQQREYQAAWLAFLRTDLPSDIYKKVRAAFFHPKQGHDHFEAGQVTYCAPAELLVCLHVI